MYWFSFQRKKVRKTSALCKRTPAPFVFCVERKLIALVTKSLPTRTTGHPFPCIVSKDGENAQCDACRGIRRPLWVREMKSQSRSQMAQGADGGGGVGSSALGRSVALRFLPHRPWFLTGTVSAPRMSQPLAPFILFLLPERFLEMSIFFPKTH